MRVTAVVRRLIGMEMTRDEGEGERKMKEES